MRCGELIVIAILSIPARAAPRDVGPCHVDDDRTSIVVEATVITIEQPAYQCVPYTPARLTEWTDLLDVAGHEEPSSSAGCIIITSAPSCQRGIELDGVARAATSVDDTFRVCALAPGPHVIVTCSRRGTVRCAFDAIANDTRMLEIQPVTPRAQLRIDRVLLGTVQTGAQLWIDPVDFGVADRLELPTRATFAWHASLGLPQARVCERKPSQPGCSRCDAADVGATNVLAMLLVAANLARRRSNPILRG
jgi:hypothetical protein